MSVANELFALIPAADVDAAVTALHRQGIAGSELEVRDPDPGWYLAHDERLHEDAASARRGGVAGAAVGAVVGLVAAAVVFGTEPLVAWVVLAFGGGAVGALIGGMTGLQLQETMDDDPREWIQVGGGDDLKLLCVHCLHFRNRAHHILERFPTVRFLDTDQPRPMADA